MRENEAWKPNYLLLLSFRENNIMSPDPVLVFTTVSMAAYSWQEPGPQTTINPCKSLYLIHAVTHSLLALARSLN